MEICDSEVIWIKTIGKRTVTPLGEDSRLKIVSVAFRKWEGLNVCITDYLPLFFLKAAGGTRVEGYYRVQASGPAPFFFNFFDWPENTSENKSKNFRSATRSVVTSLGGGI